MALLFSLEVLKAASKVVWRGADVVSSLLLLYYLPSALLNVCPFPLSITCTLRQTTLTYFVRGNITVLLTSCLTGLDSAILLNWNYKQIYLFGQILTGQTGGQAYSDISITKWVSVLWLRYRVRDILCTEKLYFSSITLSLKIVLNCKSCVNVIFCIKPFYSISPSFRHFTVASPSKATILFLRHATVSHRTDGSPLQFDGIESTIS